MKLELNKYDAELPADVNLALVISGEITADGQRHTGFLVRNLLGEYMLFHLGSNNLFLKTSFNSSYNSLLIPILERETETAIVGFLAYLYGVTSGSLPYSIAWEEGKEYFDADGKPVVFGPSDGFTCATFVLESLKRYGLDMVERSTWPVTDDDKAWQLGIISDPRLQLSAEQFLAQVEKIGSCPRFRPEQALGAAHYFKNSKLPHSTVFPAGQEVIAEMARLRA